MPENRKLSQAQIEALGTKIDKFSQSLDADEQLLFRWILEKSSKAASAELSEKDLDSVVGGAGMMGMKSPTANMIGSMMPRSSMRKGNTMADTHFSWVY